MPVPVNRSKILPARGSKADLDEGLADLLEGEMAYASDERRYYQKQGGVLVPVGGDGGGTGSVAVTTLDVATSDGSEQGRALRNVIPPDLPVAWTDLVNQRETNWWIFREIEHVADRVTNIELNGGGGDVDLDGLATEEWVLEQIQNIEIPDGGSGEMPLLQVDGSLAMVRTEDTPWPEPAEGQTWMDPVAMQQMVWWRGQWVPSSPAYGGGGGGGDVINGWKHLPDLPDLMDAAQPVAKVYGKRKG